MDDLETERNDATFGSEMLLVDDRNERAVVVPLWPLAVVAAGLLAAAVVPWYVALFIAACAVCGLVFGLRWLRRDAGHLVVRGVGWTRRIDAASAAFGYRVTGVGKNTMIEVYVTDGGEKIRVLNHLPLGPKRATASVGKLQAALLGSMESACSPGGLAVKADIEILRHAREQVEAYYASPAWRRPGYLILGILIAYLLGMALFFWLCGE